MRLSDEQAAKTKPPKKGYAYKWDDPHQGLAGFGVRVTAGGARSWVARYRVGTKQRVQTIAPIHGLSAAKARKTAGEIIAKAKLGHDTVQEVRERKAQVDAAKVKDIADKYLAHQQRRYDNGAVRSATLYQARYCVGTLAQPLYGKFADKLTRKEVAAWKEAIAKKNGTRIADTAGTELAAMFNHALLIGETTNPNPASNLPRAHEKEARERVLDDEEIREVWRAAKPDTDYGAIIRLLMLTGCRRTEIGAMRSGEIDGRWFTLPKGRAKNKKRHAVYLTPPALALAKPKMNRDRLFGENPDGEGFSGWSRAKRRLDDDSATSDWTVHDLRRTVATRMNGLGLPPHVVEVCLNHIDGARAGVAGTYNRYDYGKEIREAWLKWARELQRIIRDGKS